MVLFNIKFHVTSDDIVKVVSGFKQDLLKGSSVTHLGDNKYEVLFEVQTKNIVVTLTEFCPERVLVEYEVSINGDMVVLQRSVPDATPLTKWSDESVEELDLGVRPYNCLKRGGIQTIGELLQRSRAELAMIPNFGTRSLDSVENALAEKGLKLKQS